MCCGGVGARGARARGQAHWACVSAPARAFSCAAADEETFPTNENENSGEHRGGKNYTNARHIRPAAIFSIHRFFHGRDGRWAARAAT